MYGVIKIQTKQALWINHWQWW